MKNLLSLIVIITVSAVPVHAQDSYKISGVQIGFGVKGGGGNAGTVNWNNIRKNSADPTFGTQLTAGYTAYEARYFYFKPFAQFSLSFTTPAHDDREWRIGLSSYAIEALASVAKMEKHGDTNTYYGLRYSENHRFLSLDVSGLRCSHEFWKNCRLYSGIAATAGVSVSDYARLTIDSASDTGRPSLWYYWGSGNRIKSEFYDLKTAVNLSAYIPFGFSFRLSKSIDLNFEDRPGLYYVKVFGAEGKSGLNNLVCVSAKYKW